MFSVFVTKAVSVTHVMPFPGKNTAPSCSFPIGQHFDGDIYMCVEYRSSGSLGMPTGRFLRRFFHYFVNTALNQLLWREVYSLASHSIYFSHEHRDCYPRLSWVNPLMLHCILTWENVCTEAGRKLLQVQ